MRLLGNARYNSPRKLVQKFESTASKAASNQRVIFSQLKGLIKTVSNASFTLNEARLAKINNSIGSISKTLMNQGSNVRKLKEANIKSIQSAIANKTQKQNSPVTRPHTAGHSAVSQGTVRANILHVPQPKASTTPQPRHDASVDGKGVRPKVSQMALGNNEVSSTPGHVATGAGLKAVSGRNTDLKLARKEISAIRKNLETLRKHSPKTEEVARDHIIKGESEKFTKLTADLHNLSNFKYINYKNNNGGKVPVNEWTGYYDAWIDIGNNLNKIADKCDKVSTKAVLKAIDHGI